MKEQLDLEVYLILQVPEMPNKNKKFFDNVTDAIIKDGNAKSMMISPITGIRYEQPLKDAHPELDLALMYAQPGSIIAKAFAPSMAKGMIHSIASGDTESLMSSFIPGGDKIKQLSSRITELTNNGGKGSRLYYQLVDELNGLKSQQPLTKSMLTGANQLAKKNALESELSAIEADLPKLQKKYNEIYNSVLRDYKGAKPEFNLDSYASEGSGLSAALNRKYEILEELGINSNKKGTIDYFIEDLPFKNGGKIHIKKKNRGKFTDYCGGKVTEECIRRGKNSSNPTIRKRATFAANARKWNKK